MILKASASMLDHQKPFDSLRDHRGGDLAIGAGVCVTILQAGFLLLQSASESTLQDALTGEIGLELPAPQRACFGGEYALLWLAPAEWLLELPAGQAKFLESALTRRLATSLAAVTDMTDAFAYCELSGARAPEVLMSGCSLNLRSHAFPAGHAARTALADMPVIIWNPGHPQRLRCLVDRSSAGHVRNWLTDAARGHRSSDAR